MAPVVGPTKEKDANQRVSRQKVAPLEFVEHEDYCAVRGEENLGVFWPKDIALKCKDRVGTDSRSELSITQFGCPEYGSDSFAPQRSESSVLRARLHHCDVLM